MGLSTDYPTVPEWVAKPEGYTDAVARYKGNIFRTDFWGSEPGTGDPLSNGWRLFDELYDQTPHTPTERLKIIAYIPTWRTKEGFNYGNGEMYQYITHGIISFLTFSETDLGQFTPTSVTDITAILRDVLVASRPHGTRIMIAVGGADDYGFLNLMTAVGNDPATPHLDQAVRNVVNFVTANALDGVDLDLECWWGKPGEQDQGGRKKTDGPHPAGRGLTLFAQKQREALPGKIVSATTFGTSWYGNNYDPALVNYVDWLGIMTYDLTGSWDQTPVGPHTALQRLRRQATSTTRAADAYQETYAAEQQGDWPKGRATDQPLPPGQDSIGNNPILTVEDSLWYWTNPFFTNHQGAGQGLPRAKIAAGIPIYGYDFAAAKEPDDLTGQVPPGYKTLRYKDILAAFPDAHRAPNASIKVPGTTPRPPLAHPLPPGDYPYAHNIYFETPDTAVAKLNFLKNVGTQGVIIWELSNDVWEDGKSIIKALYANSGNPTTRPALVRFNKSCFLCTHNSYKNDKDGWLWVNQSFDLRGQLDRGVRALMLDVYYEPYLGPGGLDWFHVIPESGVYVLGEVRDGPGWILGSTYVKPALRFRDALNQIGSWLVANPNEVVTIPLEDRFSAAKQIESEIALVDQRYRDMIYNPNKDPSWNLPQGFSWPYLSDMVAQNKRLLLFSGNSEFGRPGTDFSWVAWDRDYIKENNFEWKGTDCPIRYGYAPVPYDRLVLLHHYRSIPLGPTFPGVPAPSDFDNRYEVIMDRLKNSCAATIGPRPNFVAVDFFQLPHNEKNAADVVAEINRRFAMD